MPIVWLDGGPESTWTSTWTSNMHATSIRKSNEIPQHTPSLALFSFLFRLLGYMVQRQPIAIVSRHWFRNPCR